MKPVVIRIRILICQEEQLQQAAKSNEEAQAVINQLKASLGQLEIRLKQVRTARLSQQEWAKTVAIRPTWEQNLFQVGPKAGLIASWLTNHKPSI